MSTPVNHDTPTLLLGDNLPHLRALPDNSIDAIVTDPPYGLGKEPDALAMLRDWLDSGHHEVKGKGFMGKEWDAFVPQPVVWKECLRVLKPGGHLLSFAGTRTVDLVGLGLRIAGFELRDELQWLYGSGFPKSLDVSKAIDKAAGKEREVVGTKVVSRDFDTSKGEDTAFRSGRPGETVINVTAPATDAARQWDGFGTALKPSHEPILLARKPLDGTVAANVLKWGTGALNIDGCRVAGTPEPTRFDPATHDRKGWRMAATGAETAATAARRDGRFPPNLLHDGSPEVLACFPETGKSSGGRNCNISKTSAIYGGGNGLGQDRTAEDVRGDPGFGDSGSAARFFPACPFTEEDIDPVFYCPKAGKRERDAGLEEFEAVHRANGNKWTDQDYRVSRGERPRNAESGPRRNIHPTVKPVALMRWLVRLVTPPGGKILDPYLGSGTTGIAATAEGLSFIGIELSPEYLAIAQQRMGVVLPEPTPEPTPKPACFDIG